MTREERQATQHLGSDRIHLVPATPGPGVQAETSSILALSSWREGGGSLVSSQLARTCTDFRHAYLRASLLEHRQAS